MSHRIEFFNQFIQMKRLVFFPCLRLVVVLVVGGLNQRDIMHSERSFHVISRKILPRYFKKDLFTLFQEILYGHLCWELQDHAVLTVDSAVASPCLTGA